jgi:hypothetical protein
MQCNAREQLPRSETLRLLASLASHWGFSAELHWCCFFATASAESDSNDGSGENDCALHSLFSCVVPASTGSNLASHLRSSRNFSTKLHWCRFFTTACTENNCYNCSGNHD